MVVSILTITRCKNSLELTEWCLQKPLIYFISFFDWVVVARTHIGKSKRFDVVLVIFVKSSDRFGASRIDLYWPSVYLWQSLYFDIVSPYSILHFPWHIFVQIFSDIILKKHFLIWNVFETQSSDFLMILLRTVKLIRNWSEKTVAISSNILHHIIF